MKITHYFCKMRLEDGGPVRGVLDLTAAMKRLGHEVTLVTADDTDVPGAWKSPSKEFPLCRRIAAPAIRGGFYSRSQKSVLHDAVRGSDVAHVHGVWTPANLQIARACRTLGIPYVWSLRGTLDDWSMGERTLKKRAYLALGGRSGLEHAAFCHCTAQDEARQSHKWFPRGRARVIPNLLDLTPFAELPGPALAREKFAPLRSGRPSILFLSRLHYKKGIPLLIEAADLLRARGVDAEVLIAGTGEDSYREELAGMIRRRGLQDRVHLVGFVSGALKLSLYQASDLFVLPTSQENFGFVLFEALACGTPLITTRGVDTWPELEASGGGVIVDADAGKIAESAAALLADRERLAGMGRSGRAWVFEHLNPATIGASFDEMYRLASGGGVSP
jgi:glycosyltransferase involved in cell wall biosynthesis